MHFPKCSWLQKSWKCPLSCNPPRNPSAQIEPHPPCQSRTAPGVASARHWHLGRTSQWTLCRGQIPQHWGSPPLGRRSPLAEQPCPSSGALARRDLESCHRTHAISFLATTTGQLPSNLTRFPGQRHRWRFHRVIWRKGIPLLLPP